MKLSWIEERIFAGRWIAGERITDAIRVGRALNSENITAIINYLGEQYERKQDVNHSVKEYLRLIDDVKKDGIRADIAVKATQIGLMINKLEFLRNYAKIVNFAKKSNVFVWLDMEEREFVEATIDAYVDLMGKGNTGICIQAYLRRSQKDLAMLLKRGAVVRLVKGAYRGSGVGLDAQSTERNYSRLMNYLFVHGMTFTIASHSQRIIERARRMNKRYKRNVTYAMLEGIHQGYAEKLSMEGEQVSVYVPFGPKWKEYAFRRLKELRNIRLLARSMLGG